ncbi:innexin inx2-like [Penaeus indicus]|uniref:innexin inx2-like n=1 Tax=Penaeus indicus TaxID=29960 RepID=UPI00300D67DC
MFEVFGGLKKHVSTKASTAPQVTSPVLLSLRLSMLMTLLACVLVTAKTYIGDNIKCITGFEKQEHKAIETYCFIASTFTLVDLEGKTVPHPGVGPDAPRTNEDGTTEEPDRLRHAYYQWVPMVLVLQAVIYYFPSWLWDKIDKKFFSQAICDLDKIHIGSIEDKLKTSSEYFSNSHTTHRSYAINFLLCECLGFVIAVSNLFFTNAFLGGNFFEFGPGSIKYLSQHAADPDNPLNEIFPKVAKCTWYKYGASGSIQKFDSMCVLPLNIVNEKTYIFLWMIYVLTASVCGVVLLFHLILFFVPNFRNTYLVFLARGQTTKDHLLHILHKGNYGDWFLVHHFQKNMAYFKQWVAKVRMLMDETKRGAGSVAG